MSTTSGESIRTSKEVAHLECWGNGSLEEVGKYPPNTKYSGKIIYVASSCLYSWA